MNTRPEPLLVGGGDEGLKLGKEGREKGGGGGFGMGNRVCRSPEDQEDREEEVKLNQILQGIRKIPSKIHVRDWKCHFSQTVLSSLI